MAESSTWILHCFRCLILHHQLVQYHLVLSAHWSFWLSPLCLMSAIKFQGVSSSEIADYIPICDSSTHVCSVPHFSDFVFKSRHSSWTCHSLILPSSHFLAHLYYHSYPLVCFSFAVLACTNPTLKKKLTWTGEMILPVKCLLYMAEHLSSVSGIHVKLGLAFVSD